MSDVSKILDWAGFRTMAAWFMDVITSLINNLWATERSTYIAEIRQEVATQAYMKWVGTENNVNMLCDFGVEGQTYTLGTWTVTDGGVTYTSDQVDGQDLDVTYSANVTYLGGTEIENESE